MSQISLVYLILNILGVSNTVVISFLITVLTFGITKETVQKDQCKKEEKTNKKGGQCRYQYNPQIRSEKNNLTINNIDNISIII